jgi:HD-like signal output (HDOD) protein
MAAIVSLKSAEPRPPYTLAIVPTLLPRRPVIGRFFRKLFGARGASPMAVERVVLPVPAVVAVDAADGPVPPGALPADEVEDRFYRLVLGAAPSLEPGMSPLEQTLLRRLKDAFGAERFDAGMLPRLPSVVPQLMRALRSEDTDSRMLAEQITRDTVLVGEIIRVANSAFFRAARPVTGLPQAITLLGHNGLRRVVMQLVMRPILRTDDAGGQRQAGERLWEHAERCARACTHLGKPACDPFEAFLAGLVSHTGAQAILAELDRHTDVPPAYSRPFVAALAQQMERLSLHAARHWEFPSRVVQALAERADPADAGARTPLGRALLAASRVAMLDVLVEQGVADADAVLLAVPGQSFSQAQLVECQETVRSANTVEA